MSTKIYTAYRLRNDTNLWPTLWAIKAHAQDEARDRLARSYRDILDGRAQALAEWRERVNEAFEALAERVGADDFGARVRLSMTWEPPGSVGSRPVSSIGVTDREILAGVDAGPERMPSLLDVDHWIRKRYGDQLASMERNRFALDISIAVRVDGRYAYLIPYCEPTSLVGGSLAFLDEYDGLEPFGYWNHTDRPDDVTARAWGQRRRIWTGLQERWSEYVLLDIVSWHGFHEVSPTAILADEYRERVV